MKLTPEKLTAFCAALAETCNVGKAAAAVGISRYTAYIWRRDIPEFATAWDEAMKAGLLALEDEAHRRAFEGIDKPLSHQGQFTYLRDWNAVNPDTGKLYDVPPILKDENGNPKLATMKEYSDTLAIFLLKAHAPEKYRDNSKLELAGSLELRKLSDEEIDEELAQLVALVGHSTTKQDSDVSDLV